MRPVRAIAAGAVMLAAAAAVLLLLLRWETRPTAQTEDDPYAGEDESLTYDHGGW